MKQVLIVEPDSLLASQWATMLNHAGIQAVHHTNATAAIDSLKTDTVDLVIVDLAIAGAELNEAVKSKEGKPASRESFSILFYSALSMDCPPQMVVVGEEGDAIFSETFQRISPRNAFAKPVDDHALLRRVEELLAEHPSAIQKRANATPFQDMDDRRLNLAKLEETQQQLGMAVAGGEVGLWDWHLDTNDVYFSPEWHAQIGATPGTLTDVRDWEERIHPDDKERISQLVRQYLSGDVDEYRAEFRFRHADGHYLQIRAVGEAVRDAEGTPIRFSGTHVNVTDLRRAVDEKNVALAELASSESKYRTLYEDSPIMHVNVDRQATVRDCNRRLVERLGYSSKEEIIGKPVFHLYHQDCWPDAEAAFQRFVAEGVVRDVELALRDKSGVKIPVVLNVDSVRDPTGQLLYSSSSWVEISELKLAQNAVDELSEQRRAMLELLGTSDGVWDWHPGTQDAQYAPGFRKMLGFAGDDVEGFPDQLHSFESRLHPDDAPVFWATIETAFRQQLPFSHEFRVQCADGRYAWMRGRATASYDGEGNPVRLVGSIYDISGQKAAERERDRFFITAVEFLAVVDLKSQRWAKVSPNWPTALGYRPEQMLDMTFADVHGAEERDAIATQILRLQNGEQVRGWICQAQHQDGLSRFIEWNFDPPQSGEDVVYGSGRDVTVAREHLVQIENHSRELERINSQLSRSNKDLEQFVYVASHDLQEPLRAIGGFLVLLKNRYSEQLDERANGYIEKAVGGASRMSQLINDLLHYARVTRDESHFVPVDLNQCVTLACQELNELIMTSNARIDVGDLVTVDGIQPLIVQMFQNLIGNAIRYRGDDTPHLKIFTEVDDSEVLVHVQDNGMGIAEEYHSQVFVLFKRLHHREQFLGTGVGLAICKRVAERHNGTISLQSQIGEGSCFTVRFPR